MVWNHIRGYGWKITKVKRKIRWERTLEGNQRKEFPERLSKLIVWIWKERKTIYKNSCTKDSNQKGEFCCETSTSLNKRHWDTISTDKR